MCPNCWRAVCGSNRSLAISQNPDPSMGPSPEICRYTAQAAAAGATGVRSHSARRNTAFAAKASGTNTTGVSRTSIFEPIATRTIEKAEVAMTTIGRSVTSRYVRNSASRVALPAMNWPLTAAAQSIAIKGDEGRRGVGETICNRKEARSPQRVALAPAGWPQLSGLPDLTPSEAPPRTAEAPPR